MGYIREIFNLMTKSQAMNIPLQLSPMMQQWHDLKAQQKEAILLFRLGDFYEAFHEDAEVLSDTLDITLTKRHDVPMSGIPHHSASSYIDKLLKKGFKIAIAEQVENPKEVKGLVKREIVKILSPGAVFESGNLEENKHHFMALVAYHKNQFCLAWLDISLNEAYFQILESLSDLLNLLSLISPKELLIHHLVAPVLEPHKRGWPISIIFSEVFEAKLSQLDIFEELIKKHFNLHSLNSSGIESELSIFSMGKLLQILKNERLYDLKNVTTLLASFQTHYLIIDKSTQSHLELFDKKEGKYEHLTLFNYLNHTLTTSGSRLFESWLKFPLISEELIKERQQGVSFFVSYEKTPTVRKILKGLKDIQKLLTKIQQKFCHAGDLKNLQKTLEGCQELFNLYEPSSCPLVNKAFLDLKSPEDLIELIDKAIIDSPAIKLHEGPTFKKGYNLNLDELTLLTGSQNEYLKTYENTLKEQTGIKNLKVGSGKNCGFFIEISKAQALNAPNEFIRRQTLTNSERFTTSELIDLEKKSYQAQTLLFTLEQSLFSELLEKILPFSVQLMVISKAIGLIDALQGLAFFGTKEGYVLPQFSKQNQLILEKARHPIIEELIGHHNFISNDLIISKNPETLLIITGPNMGGKSTFMRQAALCVIMAQIGSYVPATKMEFSPCDKLFTRIGASDDLSSGQSTFMVEMAETAYILKNATANSLVILDEIGRGTSTYDGIALAYAIAKYLLKHPKGAPKTLFATHYFELTALSLETPFVINYHAAVKEEKKELLFLHKIIKGSADKSYGIHVAKIAGLPQEVISLAKNKLQSLLDPEWSLFTPPQIVEEPIITSHPLVETLQALPLDELTPLEALNRLHAWKKQYLT